MNRVVTSRVPYCGSGLGDLEWNFKAPVSSSEKVYPGVLPGDGGVCASTSNSDGECGLEVDRPFVLTPL